MNSDRLDVATVDWAHRLSVADDGLLLVGGVVAAIATLYWLIRMRRDPLSGSPDLPNRLGPEGLLLPVLVWMFAGGALGLLVDAAADDAEVASQLLFTGNAAQALGGLACIWVGSRFFAGGGKRFLLGEGRVVRDVVCGVLCLPAALVLCQVILEATNTLVTRFEPEYSYFQHDVIDALRSGKTPLWTLWIGTALIAPIAEECFFRGIFQTFVGNFLKSRWLTVLLVGAVFGAVHAGGGDSPQPHVVPALTGLGVLLGVLYMRTGSLVGPIALHALFNAKTLLWECLLSEGG